MWSNTRNTLSASSSRGLFCVSAIFLSLFSLSCLQFADLGLSEHRESRGGSDRRGKPKGEEMPFLVSLARRLATFLIVLQQITLETCLYS